MCITVEIMGVNPKINLRVVFHDIRPTNDLVSSKDYQIPGLEPKLHGHKFKDDHEVAAVVTRWLITQDTD
jgi:hypothetical protein